MSEEKKTKSMCEVTYDAIVYPPLEHDFRELIKTVGGCVEWAAELIRGEAIICIIKSSIEQQEIIEEMAFMTFVKNPEFQKYYKDDECFKQIAINHGY